MTTKTDTTSERADFEAAYASTFPTAAFRPDKFDQESWGEYRDAYVVVGWRMWQAGRAAVEADRKRWGEPVSKPYPVKLHAWGGASGYHDYEMSDGSIQTLKAAEAAHALLSRYGESQLTASAEPDTLEEILERERNRPYPPTKPATVPSDEDILAACKSLGWDLDAQEEADMILLVRTVMSRYGSGQPAASPAGSPADSIGFCSFDPDDRFYHSKDRTWWRREDDGMLVRAEAPAEGAELELRSLLAHQYAGAALYRDDGELQDNSATPLHRFFTGFARADCREDDEAGNGGACRERGAAWCHCLRQAHSQCHGNFRPTAVLP